MRGGAILIGFLVCCAAVMAQQARSSLSSRATKLHRAQLIKALSRYEIDLTPPIEPTTADDAAYFLREFFVRAGIAGG